MEGGTAEGCRSRTLVGVETAWSAVAPFVECARKAGDSDTRALGFVYAAVYEEFARKGQLYIALAATEGEAEYAGHLLFDLCFPRAKVLQIYCAESWRRTGVASLLLNELIGSLTQAGFISLQARVADDLELSNLFWERKGFYVQRSEPGRGSKPRQINVRILELDTPQLFARSPLAEMAKNPLGLRPQEAAEVPYYLADLNVLFDLACQRIRHEQAADLFRAVHAGHCRLGVSVEAERELERTKRNGSVDPMYELVKLLPQFCAPENWVEENSLIELVFPDQSRQMCLSANDRSDIRHLGTAIHNRLSGFITSDEALLRAAPMIEQRYSLRVLSPAAFRGAPLDDARSMAVITQSERRLEVRPADARDLGFLSGFLASHGLGPAKIGGDWAVSGSSTEHAYRFCALIQGQVVGYITWRVDVADTGELVVHAFVNETHHEAPVVARSLLRILLDSIREPRLLRMYILAQQSELRELALQCGFYSGGPSGELIKIALGRILTPNNWTSERQRLERVCGFRLPEAVPSVGSGGGVIEVRSPDGFRRQLSLDLLEKNLSPALLCLPGRCAVVSPIEPRYSDTLLGHSPQGSLLPKPIVGIHGERNYLCDPKAIKRLKPGALILFYESLGAGSGSQAIVAIGRIVRSYLKRRDDLDASELAQSALTAESIGEIGSSDMKAVASIDNILPFLRPVPLSFLRAIGCGEANHLITTNQIDDEKLQAILNEGML